MIPTKVILTIVIRDLTPFIHMQEPITHRTVRIELIPEQLALIDIRATSSVGGSPIFEDISMVFVENVLFGNDVDETNLEREKQMEEDRKREVEWENDNFGFEPDNIGDK